MKALLGQKLEDELAAFLTGQSHARILIGAELSNLVPRISEHLKSEGDATLVDHLVPEGASISIDQIRGKKHSLSLKQASGGVRVLVIDAAQTMSHEAQNSLLKLLEEPPEGVKFLLLSAHSDALLATIRSRATPIHIQKLSIAEAEEHYSSQDVKSNDFARAFAITEGHPGRLFALLSDQNEGYAESINIAKSILGGDHFDRLLHIETLSKDKPKLASVFSALEDVLRSLMHGPNATDEALRAFAKKRRVIMQAKESMDTNVNAKLLALDALLRL